MLPAMSPFTRMCCLKKWIIAKMSKVNEWETVDYWVEKATNLLVENKKLKAQNKLVRKRLSQLSLKVRELKGD